MAEDTPIYSIGQVEKMTGLTARRIRYYEQARLLTPGRSQANRRLYSLANIEQLKLIKELLDKGWTVVGIRNQFQAQRNKLKPEPKEYFFPRELASLYPVN